MQDALLRDSLAILNALRGFCLAKRVLDGFCRFVGRDSHIHPYLSPIRLHSADVRSVHRSSFPISLGLPDELVLSNHGGHSGLANVLSDVWTHTHPIWRGIFAVNKCH